MSETSRKWLGIRCVVLGAFWGLVGPSWGHAGESNGGLPLISGPPAPPDYYQTPVSLALADRMAGHAIRVSLGSAADLFSTSAALHWCKTCGELNPGGWDAEARISLKLGVSTLTLGGAWILERDGHSGWAKVLSWVFLAQSLFFAGSNTLHAIRGY